MSKRLPGGGHNTNGLCIRKESWKTRLRSWEDTFWAPSVPCTFLLICDSLIGVPKSPGPSKEGVYKSLWQLQVSSSSVLSGVENHTPARNRHWFLALSFSTCPSNALDMKAPLLARQGSEPSPNAQSNMGAVHGSPKQTCLSHPAPHPQQDFQFQP